MKTLEEIAMFRDGAVAQGDMLTVAVCQRALGEEVTADLNSLEAYRFGQLDAADQERSQALVTLWMEKADAYIARLEAEERARDVQHKSAGAEVDDGQPA